MSVSLFEMLKNFANDLVLGNEGEHAKAKGALVISLILDAGSPCSSYDMCDWFLIPPRSLTLPPPGHRPLLEDLWTRRGTPPGWWLQVDGEVEQQDGDGDLDQRRSVREVQ